MEKVSAIITTHNRLALLKRAIESVRKQTYGNLEIVVVDDHSTDGTRAYCEALPYVNYIHITGSESKGGNYARNKGIKASTGEYVAFLDDDDYWLPEKVEKQVSHAKSTGSVLVYCGYRIEKIENAATFYKEVLPLQSNCGDMSVKILMTIPTTTSNILVRRSALESIGLFDENLRFWQEYEMMIRLSLCGDFDFVNEVLSVYRIDKTDSNRLTNNFEEWRVAVRTIREKHESRYGKLNLYECLCAKAVEWNDARIRCRSCGARVRAAKYYALSFPIRLVRFIGRKLK